MSCAGNAHAWLRRFVILRLTPWLQGREADHRPTSSSRRAYPQKRWIEEVGLAAPAFAHLPQLTFRPPLAGHAQAVLHRAWSRRYATTLEDAARPAPRPKCDELVGVRIPGPGNPVANHPIAPSVVGRRDCGYSIRPVGRWGRVVRADRDLDLTDRRVRSLAIEAHQGQGSNALIADGQVLGEAGADKKFKITTIERAKALYVLPKLTPETLMCNVKVHSCSRIRP